MGEINNMRINKYRGKRIDNNEWVYGYYVATKDSHYICYENQYNDDLFLSPKNIMIEVVPETIGQFIGWKDKDGKGKEMFEGDIFKDWLGQLSIIAWKDFRWAFETINEPSFKYRANFHNIGEVIGNKYDNIELLEIGDNTNEN